MRSALMYALFMTGADYKDDEADLRSTGPRQKVCRPPFQITQRAKSLRQKRISQGLSLSIQRRSISSNVEEEKRVEDMALYKLSLSCLE